MERFLDELILRRALAGFALLGLLGGLAAWGLGHGVLAGRIWMAGTIPVVAWLAVSIVRDLMAGPMTAAHPFQNVFIATGSRATARPTIPTA